MPILTLELLQIWIDFGASFLNIADYKPNDPAEKKAQKTLVERIKKLNIQSRM